MKVNQGEATAYVDHFLDERHVVWTGKVIVVRTYVRTYYVRTYKYAPTNHTANLDGY